MVELKPLIDKLTGSSTKPKRLTSDEDTQECCRCTITKNHHQEIGYIRKPVPGCAGNIGTGNASGCALAKITLVKFELMVYKGTADGGGNT